MNKREREIVAALKARFDAANADVRKLIVFGSHARGEAGPDSDLDVLALVHERTPELEQRLDDIAYSVMWDFDFQPIISLKVMSEAQFSSALQHGCSFYRNVAREGVTV